MDASVVISTAVIPHIFMFDAVIKTPCETGDLSRCTPPLTQWLLGIGSAPQMELCGHRIR